MDAKLGWALAVLAVALGWVQWGWQGAVLAVSGVVFWLLLQFSQALRAMRDAGRAPVGTVPSAVMLHARLKQGQRLIDVIRVTRSLGRKLADEPETWIWADASGAAVTLRLAGGRVTDWTLSRPEEVAAAASPPAAPSA